MALLCAQDASAQLQRLEGIEAEWFESFSNCKKNLELCADEGASKVTVVVQAGRVDRCDHLNEWFQDELLKTRIALQEIGVEADTILQRQARPDDAGGPSADKSPASFDVETKALLERLRAATERMFALSHAPFALSAVAVISWDALYIVRFLKSLMKSDAMGPAAVDGLLTMFLVEPCALTSATDWLMSATCENRTDLLPHLVQRLPPSGVKEAFFEFVHAEEKRWLRPRQALVAYNALSSTFDLQFGSTDFHALRACVLSKLTPSIMSHPVFEKTNAVFALFACQRGIVDARMDCFSSYFVFLLATNEECDDDMYMDVLQIYSAHQQGSTVKEMQHRYVELSQEAVGRRSAAFLDVLLRSQLFREVSDANSILVHFEALIQTACFRRMFSYSESPQTKDTLLRITSHPAAVYAFFSNEALTDAVRFGQIDVVRVILQDPAIVPSTFLVSSASEKQNPRMMELLLSDPRVIPAVKRYQRDSRDVAEFRETYDGRLFVENLINEAQALDWRRLEDTDGFPTREGVRSIHAARQAARRLRKKRGKWNQERASSWFQASRARLNGFIAEIVAWEGD
jgi:hypothetical protein